MSDPYLEVIRAKVREYMNECRPSRCSAALKNTSLYAARWALALIERETFRPHPKNCRRVVAKIKVSYNFSPKGQSLKTAGLSIAR